MARHPGDRSGLYVLAVVVAIAAATPSFARIRDVPLVRISESSSGHLSCAGTVMHERFVLSARHCATNSRAYVRRTGSRYEVVERALMGKTRDLVAYELQTSARKSLELSSPLNAERIEHASLWVATSDRGLTRVRLSSHNEIHIHVFAPDAGLCHGDSGSPLLLQTGEDLRIVGVFDVGAEDCAADKLYRFARVDNLEDLRQRVTGFPAKKDS